MTEQSLAMPLPTLLVTPDGTLDVGRFELVGTALARSALTSNVTVYSQGRVESLFSPSGAQYDAAGLNQSYEITYLIGFGETQSVGPDGDLIFALDPTNPVNYFELLLNASPDANPLQGTGFSDGTLILGGRITDLASTFTFVPSSAALDQFGRDDYPGIQSLVASGVDTVTVAIDAVDTTAFPKGAPDVLHGIAPSDFPFTFTDPSRQYQTPGEVQLPDIGTTNGADGPDLVLETRTNLTFVPEPIALDPNVKQGTVSTDKLMHFLGKSDHFGYGGPTSPFDSMPMLDYATFDQAMIDSLAELALKEASVVATDILHQFPMTHSNAALYATQEPNDSTAILVTRPDPAHLKSALYLSPNDYDSTVGHIA